MRRLFFIIILIFTARGYSQKIDLIAYEKTYSPHDQDSLLYVDLRLSLEINSDTTVLLTKREREELVGGEITLKNLGLKEEVKLELSNGDILTEISEWLLKCEGRRAAITVRARKLKKGQDFITHGSLFSVSGISYAISNYNQSNKTNRTAKKVIYKIINKSTGQELYRLEYNLADTNK